MLGRRSDLGEPINSRIRTNRFHCATSGRQARDPGFRSEVVHAAIRTQSDQLLQPEHQASPRVRRRLTVGLKKLVALSANGSVHNFRTKSGISCLTTRSCATKSVGSYSIVDRLAQTAPSAQQSVHPTSGILRDLQAFSGFEFILLSSRIHASPLAGNANR